MRPHKRLKSERVQIRIAGVPNWQAEESTAIERKAAMQEFGETMPRFKAIRRSFRFSCFLESMAFVDRVADLAWEMDVTPSIYIHDEHVEICLPGDRQGLSDADFDLAETIDSLVD